MMKITFKVEENGDAVDQGSTSAACHGIDDIKNTIAEVLENVLEKELEVEFERSIRLSDNLENTFIIEELNGDKKVLCKVSGISKNDALELEGLSGDLD